MLRPSFHRSEIRDLSTLKDHVGNLIAYLPKDGLVVDLQPLFLRLTNDTIFEAPLGQSTYTLLGDDTDPRNTQMFEAVEYTAYRISIRLRMGRLATILPDRKFSEALAFVHKYVGDYISQALAPHDDEKSERYLFLKEMVEVNPNPNRVHSELLHTLSAGRETTAAVLSVLFYTIVRHPGVLQKLRNEIAVHIGGGLPTYQNIRNLEYLRWTINESKYLYIDKSSQLANIHVEKLCVYGLSYLSTLASLQLTPFSPEAGVQTEDLQCSSAPGLQSRCIRMPCTDERIFGVKMLGNSGRRGGIRRRIMCNALCKSQ